MPYKTKFIPQNTTKYVGNVDKIFCKSLWERKLCKYFDSQDNVIKWCYECIKIPYISPVDNKKHNYYPDFLVLIKEKSGEEKTLVVEVKPQKQTEAPKNCKTKSYKNEMKTFLVNDAKWKAAKNLCESNRWNFKIITEKNLFR